MCLAPAVNHIWWCLRLLRGAPYVFIFCRHIKLESDQFPHISLSVCPSSEVSLILGYEGCLSSPFLDCFKSTGWQSNTASRKSIVICLTSSQELQDPLSCLGASVQSRCPGRFRSPSRNGRADTSCIGTWATSCRRSWAWISSAWTSTRALDHLHKYHWTNGYVFEWHDIFAKDIRYDPQNNTKWIKCNYFTKFFLWTRTGDSLSKAALK